MNNLSFTLLPEINYEIVNQITDELDLYNFCLTNKYNFNICQNNNTIKNKIIVAKKITIILDQLFQYEYFKIGIGRNQPDYVDESIFMDVTLKDINKIINIGLYDTQLYVFIINLRYDNDMWTASLFAAKGLGNSISRKFTLTKKEMYYFLYYLFRTFRFNLI